MKLMKRVYTAVVSKGDKEFVSRCIELGVVSQGATVEEALTNLREAVELYLEDEPDSPNGREQSCVPNTTGLDSILPFDNRPNILE